MDPKSLEATPIVPSVVLLINLSSPVENRQNAERSRSLALQLQGQGVPATWVIDRPQQVQWLGGQDRQLATTSHELALTADAQSPQRLRSELANRQAAVFSETGQPISVVMGDPQQLRARTSLLAEMGITAVVASSPATARTAPPRSLPCGLWQIDPTLALPKPRRRWAFLPSRRQSVAQLSLGSTSQLAVITLNLNELSHRNFQDCERFLRELAEANRHQQLSLVTASALAAELTSRHEVKPQRSILRVAA